MAVQVGSILRRVGHKQAKLTPSDSAPEGGRPHPHVIEITVTWSLILPTPAEMRIRLLGKNFFSGGF
jgi:hypothetical protein